MSTMDSCVKSHIANITCSIFWVGIIVALPFLEEYLFPSVAGSSWQRGMVVTPFIIIPVVAAFYIITKKVIAKNHVAYLPFIKASIFQFLLLLLSFAVPIALVMLFIKMTPLLNLFYSILYFSVLYVITLLLPLSLWWLVVLGTHNKSFKQDK